MGSVDREPFRATHLETRRVEPVQGTEKRPDADRILIPQRLAPDQPVQDEPGLA
jgi:hypothetical protein